MLKESILFVAATGLLIYFIAPSDEPPEAQPVKEEVQKTSKASVKTTNDGWEVDGSGDDGWGDDAAGNESFTFGEPMTYPDGFGDEKSRDKEDRSASGRNQSSANSPGSGEPGSIGNPIILKPDTLPSTDDH